MISKDKILKRFLALSVVFTLVLAVVPASPAYAGAPAITAVDVVFVVDESGSMVTEQQFLPTITAQLEAAFTAAGVGSGGTPNQYGAVGYACSSNAFPGTNTPNPQDPRVVIPLGSSAAFGLATVGGAFCTTGGVQDGFEAIIYATNPANMNYRGGNIIKHIILVTDEDRDDTTPQGNPGSTSQAVDLASTITALQNGGFLFNGIMCFDFVDASNNPALGVVPPTGGTAYTENLVLPKPPNPLFDKSSPGNPSGPTACGAQGGSGTTLIDYIPISDAMAGGAWDVFSIGGGNAATQAAFAAAFADAKVQETKSLLVGGEILPINTLALLLAGAQSSLLSLLSVLSLLGAIGIGAFYFVKRKN